MAVEANAGSNWIRSLSRFGIRPGLERTQKVLDFLGNPQTGLQFFHVAGTNGKGSVCAYLSQILSVRLTVGVFTSPSFDGYLGRMTISGKPIPDPTFNELALQVQKAASTVTPHDMITEFEALTVVAILYFHGEKVDSVIWETGLGGRYDSTNVVTPLVTAITNVGMDHMNILGPTIRHIARDKAGIAKAGCPLITTAKDEALDVILSYAKAVGAPVAMEGRQFQAVRRLSGTSHVVDYRGVYFDWHGLPLALYGVHQTQNVAVALGMYEVAVKRFGYPLLTITEMRLALRSVAWPLRFERFSLEHNLVVIDGAHNEPAAEKLFQALTEVSTRELPLETKWTYVVGVLGDKDYKGILRAMLPLARRVCTATPANDRALSARDLANVVEGLGRNVEVTAFDSVKQALDAACGEPGPICVFGSLYTADEARKAMLCMEDSCKRGR